MFLAIREATIAVARYDDFRIVHMSIQRTHLHFIVEADNRLALARGMQALQISAAKQIKRVLVERGLEKPEGPVFCDRYHARIMRTPREVRNCIAYVLNNWRHHGDDKPRFARTWNVDPYSSGLGFNGWKELEDREVMWNGPETYQGLIVWRPKSFLLAELWRKHGLIRCREVPGGHSGDE
jgi:REP element-mobilizing transposase RayT